MVRAQGFLFGALLLASAAFYQPMDYDNTKSRYMLLGAVVDRGVLNIDRDQEYTIDKAEYGGHYYSIKPMGLAMMSVPVYWFLRNVMLGPATLLSDPTILNDPAAKYLVRVFSVSVPFALLGLILFQFLLKFGIPARNAFWAVIAYSFGTIALNHATIFSGHQTAAFFLFSSFALLYHAGREEASRGARSTALSLLAGLCAGCSVLCDYLVAVYAVVVAVYCLGGRQPAREKAAFVVGAMLCAVSLGIYDYACFHTPFSTGYSYLAFKPFQEYTSVGLFGISLPKPGALFGLLFSVARGLFFISPVLVFSLAGYAFLWRRHARRREFWALAAIPALAVVLYSGYHGWHGGWTFGPRYLVPVLPFLAVPLALAADGGPWFQLLFWLSAVQVVAAQIGWPHASQELRNPLVEFVVPLMREGGTALNFLGGARPGAWLAGLLQLAPLIPLGWWSARTLPAARRRRLPWSWRAVAGVWALVVVGGLAFVRTRESRVVHRYRGIVLRDTAVALRSEPLGRVAQYEFAQDR